MEDFEKETSSGLDKPPTRQRFGRKWLVIGGLALAFMLTVLGVGAFAGVTGGTAQAASLSSASISSAQSLATTNSAQTLTVVNSAPAQAFGPGAQGPGQGQCQSLTVSSVSGQTIVGKTSSGSTVTIHTTASTQYTQAGKAVAASAVKVGAQIHVMGTKNSDGSITATSIDIG